VQAITFKKDTKRDLKMEHPRLPRPGHTHIQKKSMVMLLGLAHTQTQRKKINFLKEKQTLERK
jgi:hypothetical protein